MKTETCSNCQKKTNELIQLIGRKVCINCKGNTVQHLKEGVTNQEFSSTQEGQKSNHMNWTMLFSFLSTLTVVIILTAWITIDGGGMAFAFSLVWSTSPTNLGNAKKSTLMAKLLKKMAR